MTYNAVDDLLFVGELDVFDLWMGLGKGDNWAIED
jgi:hypothetical protein